MGRRLTRGDRASHYVKLQLLFVNYFLFIINKQWGWGGEIINFSATPQSRFLCKKKKVYYVYALNARILFCIQLEFYIRL